MKVTFIYLGAENLGLEYISANLKKQGHKVTLVYDKALFDDKYFLTIPFLARFYNAENRIIRETVESNPDIVGFSVFTASYKWALNLARKIKLRIDVPIIFGGCHATATPDTVIKEDCVDAVCVGEGDNFFNEITFPLSPVIKPSLINDLNTLPFPDKELFARELDVYSSYMTMASRGCPFKCSFCQNYRLKMYKPAIRFRSVDNVIEEMEFAKSKGAKEISFKDDVFTIDLAWLEKFRSAYKKISIPFKCESHFNFLDRDKIRLLKEAGCYNVNFGVQSYSEKIRREILYRYETNKKIKYVLQTCDEEGLNYELDYILGLPGETEEGLIEASRFFSGLKLCNLIETFFLTYYPNTAIIDIAKKQGLITDEDVARINNGLTKHYFEGGEIKDEKVLKRAQNYSLFFEMIPFLNEKTAEFIIKHNLQRFFRGFAFKIVLRLAIVIKYRDARMVNYLKNLMRNVIQETWRKFLKS